MFYRNMCSKNLHKIHMKTPVSELLFKKAAGLDFRNIGTAVPGTRNSEPATHAWDPGPETLHLGSFTCDPGPTGPGT